MGSFYVNVTLKGPDQKDIGRYLAEQNLQAFVSPTIDGFTTVYEAECDKQDERHIRQFTSALSEHFTCPALAVLDHDDDMLCYWLCQNGALVHEYNSYPGYFAETPSDDMFVPAGGDAPALCQALGSNAEPDVVERVLRDTYKETQKYIFASERHSDLVTLLGLPGHSLRCGFMYLANGDYPDGLGESDFLRA